MLKVKTIHQTLYIAKLYLDNKGAPDEKCIGYSIVLLKGS